MAHESLRLDYARQRRGRGSVHLPAGTRVRRVGKVAGLVVHTVDGELIRNQVDIDFVAGGNGSRYLYCPTTEIWVEDVFTPADAAATVLHEIIEHWAMRRGRDYERAHDAALEAEARFRQGLQLMDLKKIDLGLVKRALKVEKRRA